MVGGGGRWALLVFKASLLLFQPPHHHCFFLFYSGLLKFNGDGKVHIRLAWEWVGVGKFTASVRCAGGTIWWMGGGVHKVAADPHRMFSKATKEHWLARSGYWTNLWADPKNLLLTLRSDVPSGHLEGGGVSKVSFTELHTLHWTDIYVTRFMFVPRINDD